MKVKLFIGVLLIVGLPCVAKPVEACSCLQEKPPCDAFGAADAVFSGVVVEFSKQFDGHEIEVDGRKMKIPYAVVARLLIDKAYKGVSGTEVEITTGAGGGDCGYAFQTGRHYLVYAYRVEQNGKLGTGICSRTRPLEAAKEDLAFLNTLAKAKPGGLIYGSVEKFGGDAEHGPSYSLGLMAGVKVLIEGNGNNFAALTDSDGKYSISEAPPGKYQVRIELPESFGSYANGATVDRFGSYSGGDEISVSDKGCVAKHFYVFLDGRISGKVIDASGRPLDEVRVDLVKAETLSNDRTDIKSWAAWSDEAGNYEFRLVQPGRYYLGINLVGGPDNEYPYPTTYFPNSSTPNQAKIIEVGEGIKIKGYDFKLTRLIEREVKGTVVWSDGRPATDVNVVIGLADDPHWTMGNSLAVANAGNSAEVAKDGSFSIKRLDGFRYKVQAYKIEQSPYKFYESETFEITISENMPPLKLMIPLPPSKK